MEFCNISNIHEARLVKVFAPTEFGDDAPVCSFVKPLTAGNNKSKEYTLNQLRLGRLLDTPKHAARFVSLLEMESDSNETLTASKNQVWSTTHTFLSKKKGT